MLEAMALSCFALLAVIVLWRIDVRKKKKSLKPVRYISYGKGHFDRDFTFSCECCGSLVSNTEPECPSCGGAYGGSQSYLKKKREMDEAYLRYLKDQAESLRSEVEYIEKTMAVLRSNFIMRPIYYNFDLGVPPVYTPAEDYAFRCEYCDSELHGRTDDRQGCPNCGADYATNTELRIREAEDYLEKSYYEEYMRLKELEWKQNVRNEQKDRDISTKYARQIAFLNRNAKYIAFAIVALTMATGALIYWFLT